MRSAKEEYKKDALDQGWDEQELDGIPLAELSILGESFIQEITSGQPIDIDSDLASLEEIGGPFVETTFEEEMAFTDDFPEGSTREPFPMVSR